MVNSKYLKLSKINNHLNISQIKKTYFIDLKICIYKERETIVQKY